MKKIYLGRDKKLSGVCDGIGKGLNIDPTFIRIIFVSLALMTAVVPVLIAYIVCALVLTQPPEGYVEVENSYRKITKGKEKKISGVCDGIAKYFGIDAMIVRLIFVALTLWIGGGIMAYIVCMIMIPDEAQEVNV
jgi:phage shock protein PspC (stress-responsive transcriptional regulator)